MEASKLKDFKWSFTRSFSRLINDEKWHDWRPMPWCNMNMLWYFDGFRSTTLQCRGRNTGIGGGNLSKAVKTEIRNLSGISKKIQLKATQKQEILREHNSPQFIHVACASRRSGALVSCTLPSSDSTLIRCCAVHPALTDRWPRSWWHDPNQAASAPVRRLRVFDRCPRWLEYRMRNSRWRPDSMFASWRESFSLRFVVPGKVMQ